METEKGPKIIAHRPGGAQGRESESMETRAAASHSAEGDLLTWVRGRRWLQSFKYLSQN